MKGLQRLLVGIDENGLGDHAAHAASRLASAVGAELELVHAVTIPPALWIGLERSKLEAMHGAACERAKDEMQTRLGDVERHFGLASQALTNRLHVTVGKPPTCLLERAREWNADVVFLGPHERRGAVDFGSTARKVLHRAECSVWHQPVPYVPPTAILAAIDLEEDSESTLRTTRDLAEALGASVHVLHGFQAPAPYVATGTETGIDWQAEVVVPAREATRERLDALVAGIDWNGVEHDVEMTTDVDPTQAILDRQREDQLILVAGKRHSRLGGLLLGSVAYDVVRRAECPVLACCPAP
ncbi:MAG: universal stress protein [bacterium]|nr:universal stress protein [bacterium]